MFIICAVISFLGGCVYVLCCDTNIQPWALRSESCIQLTKAESNGKLDSTTEEKQTDIITRL